MTRKEVERILDLNGKKYVSDKDTIKSIRTIVNTTKKRNNTMGKILSIGLFFYILVVYTLAINIFSDVDEVENGSYKSLSSDLLFYRSDVNGFDVYSDVDNFNRIEKLITELDIYQEDYSGIKSIYYFQNQSIDNSYIRRVPDQSCDGSYLIFSKIIELYRCDDTVRIRQIDMDEKFILAHELGHYVFEGEETWADNYAVNLTGKEINKSSGTEEVF